MIAPFPDTWASPNRYFMMGMNKSTGVMPKTFKVSRGNCRSIFFNKPVEKYWSRWGS